MMSASMRVLGIETSCDETAAAVVEHSRGKFRVLSNVVASQIKLHKKTGGVVPEVAARAHVESIVPVIREAIHPPHLNPLPKGRGIKEIDAIAVTVGPGLITSLRIGVDAARILSYVWKKPLLAVNHLEGHIYSNFLPEIDKNPKSEARNPKEIKFPAIVLIVSGGHTELVLMRKHLDYRIIGATRDDAAGEAFDKAARLFGLGYPGGPAISRIAEKGNRKTIDFPRPMLDSEDFDFSFSGLKTAVRYYMDSHPLLNPLPSRERIRADICASFEQAVVDVLVQKTLRAAEKYKAKTVMVGGGVAANSRLREEFSKKIKTLRPKPRLCFPLLEYTGDNAAMIAAAGIFRALKKNFVSWKKIEADPNLILS